MKNRDCMITILLTAGTLCFGNVVAATQAGDRSQVSVKADKAEAPKGQTARRFPRIAFGQLADTIGRVTFVQHTTFPEVPSMVRLYKVQPLASKRDALVQLFKALPMASGPETDASLRQLERESGLSADKESMSAEIGEWTVEVWKGGQFDISNRQLSGSLSNFENGLTAPTPEEAHKAADAFLASIPLLTDVHFLKAGPGRILTRGLGDKPGDVVVKSIVVSYYAAIDSIPLYGAVDVYVGPGPAVVTVNSRLRQVIPDENVGILSPQEAFDKLSAGECHWNKDPLYATCNVTSIKLGYYLGATADDLPYVMPLYVFEGDAVADGKKSSDTWKAYVEAVRPEFLETQPAHR